MTSRETCAQAFIQQAGWGRATRQLLAGDASNRRYDRLTRPDGTSAVLMDAPADKGEDVGPFMLIADWLGRQGFSAPKIYNADAENGFLLIEDLGDGLFGKLMVETPEATMHLYVAATDVLIQLQNTSPLKLAVCDTDWLIGATQLVFDWYAPDDGASTAFNTLFRPHAQRLDDVPRVVILRDYHAENLLWLPDRDGTAQVGLLDFQDALLGHPAYDLVSILQDARRDVAPDIQAAMIARYIDKSGTNAEDFYSAFALLGVQRNLRILGIFARLCLRDGKAHYVDLIPRVWAYIQRNLDHPDLCDLASLIHEALPVPDKSFLEDLKARCATLQTP
ncbi:MAG TPA: aminoglycoside phosphotransferase [Roseobacter sp.]|uniref:Aminoglycoside phosphotransferase domain-containing protein n=1 Tax=marine sediment metagenome TaxID=412755 RepID=A0A0F9TVS9_9ZZZZ|nr:aminoglycoside phosphotransferase [Roseobacter sp.]HEC70664.1 aminoglycoside phosphotransferase [Roseobacter sp.]